MSSFASNKTVCGLALLTSALTIIGNGAYIQRKHNEQDTSWLLERFNISVSKEWGKSILGQKIL
jgi:hypothetical protein